ncbi:MAG: hypothetical protein PWR01_2836 [Clostridiales bacterium]|jgi:uncharacterized membrane protein YkvA (DUF1232 family)|nr:hypothetical protein [Clostridiales bacterium]MDN5281763.1 hypothetical protein [Candidatus Ozemobacter sp.]
MKKPEPSIPKSLFANPKLQLVTFFLALIYIVSPIDFIPDAPIVGWVDDFTVFVAEVISFILYLKQKRRNFQEKANQNNEGTNNGG